MSADPEGYAIWRGAGAGVAGCTVLAPGEVPPFEPDEWRQTLVIVHSGALRLRCRSGRTATFPRGSILYLDGLALDSISADGEEDAILLTLRPAASSRSGSPYP